MWQFRHKFAVEPTRTPITCYDIFMEIHERRWKVAQAIANERLEGLSISDFTMRVLDDYISGKITAHEAARIVNARYGAE